MRTESVVRQAFESLHEMDERGCWNWKGTLDRDGYGRFCMGRYVKAHRVAWVLANGEIPPGLLVCHHCDNPRCVRPSHMFLGTPADNAADRDRKHRLPSGDAHHARLRPEVVARGIRHGRAKLNDEIVRDIRRRKAIGESSAAIGRAIGVSKQQVLAIVHMRAWKHVPAERGDSDEEGGDDGE